MSWHLAADEGSIFFRCVEDCDEAIMISDCRGVLLYVNPAWERTYGFSRQEALGKTPRLLHSGHQPDDFYQDMWDQIRNPAIGRWKGRLINRAKDGTLVHALLTITPYRDSSGEIVGYMGIAVDLRSQVELEAKVVHQDRLASIGLLASGLAHELGTPLGVVRGRAEFLRMQAQSPSVGKSVDVILSQIDRISTLIRSLLNLSRSPQELRMENVLLSDVASEVTTLLGQNLRQDGVEIRITVADDARAFADARRLEQILLNLIMNSIHAVREAIAAGRTQGHFLEVRTSLRGDRIALEVEDSGCGISPKDLKKIFDPFFTTKQVGEGTGLGLAIVAGLVHEMDGEVSVESKVGVGTKFAILLKSSSRLNQVLV